MATMKAVRIHDYGTSEVLTYEDIPRPEPGQDEILVRVRAASASPIDWKVRAGYLQGWIDLPLPAMLGRDFAGDVEAVGENITGYNVGDPVFGTVGGLGRGTYAEYIAVSPEEVAPKPKSIDYVTAASVPHSGLVAWQALVEAGGLAPGQTVLVHAAGGGVGTFAVQIGKVYKAHVIGTTSQHADQVRELGADEVIDYTTTNFEDVVHDVDIVLDTVGGDTQERSWNVLKPGGILVTLMGFAPGSLEAAEARGLRGAMVGQRPEPDQLRTLGNLIDEGQIRPIVSGVLPLSEVAQAQDSMAQGHTRGKIILQMD